MALKERRLEKINWDNPGKAVGGYLVGVNRNKFKDGSTGLTYVVRRVDDSIAIFKGATMLNYSLSTMDMGKFIQVEYLGEDDSKEVRQGMNRPKKFRVQVDDERSIPVGGSEPGDEITDADIPF